MHVAFDGFLSPHVLGAAPGEDSRRSRLDNWLLDLSLCAVTLHPLLIAFCLLRFHEVTRVIMIIHTVTVIRICHPFILSLGLSLWWLSTSQRLDLSLRGQLLLDHLLDRVL